MDERYSLVALRLFGYVYAIFMLLFLVGFFQATPPAFNTITFVLKVVVALFLLYRFNPYFNRQTTFTRLDRELIVFSAFFILISSFTDFINDFFHTIRMMVTGFLGG